MLQYSNPCHAALTLFQINSVTLCCLALSFSCWEVSLPQRSVFQAAHPPTEGIFTISQQDFPIQRIFKLSATSALRLFSLTCAMQNHLFHYWILYHGPFSVNRAPSSSTELGQMVHMCSHHSSVLPSHPNQGLAGMLPELLG